MINKDINIKLPKSWNEITLQTIQEIEGKNDDVVKVISVLAGVDEDTISSLPMSQIERIANEIQFLKQMPTVEPKPFIKWKGEKYVIHPETELCFGEYVALEMAMKANSHDYATFLAILARKENEAYTQDFENKVLASRVEMFKHMPVRKALPLVSFFLQLFLLSTSLDKTYRQVKQNTLEEIDSIVEFGKSSMKDGRGNGLRTRYVTNRLKRLKKMVKNRF